jgi:cell division protein FtsB
MKQFKALLYTLLFVVIMLVSVQNVNTLSSPVPLQFHWPGIVLISFQLPVYACLFILGVLGFVLTSLVFLGEHLSLGCALGRVQRKVWTLKQELAQERVPEPPVAPESEPESEPESSPIATPEPPPESPSAPPPEPVLESAAPAAMDVTDTTLQPPQTSRELDMEPTTSTAPTSAQPIDEQEILVAQSGPSWAGVVLLAAALALVISSAVYLVLQEELTLFSDQIADVQHDNEQLRQANDELSQTTDALQQSNKALQAKQDKLASAWEAKHTIMSSKIDALVKGQHHLASNMASLEQQMEVLSQLPDEMRDRLVAGFLRDAAGKTAFIGTQVETDAQRETLSKVETMLHELAVELDGEGN